MPLLVMLKPALLLLMLALTVAACTSTASQDEPAHTVTPPPPTVTPAPLTAEQRGQVVFFEMGCISCHSITGGAGRVGPDLKGIAAWAAENFPDTPPEQYIREGIIDVMAVVNEPWRGDLMPQNYAERLTPQQVDDLVAYLLALE